jgi:CubicO group peptidase (beta-lactamase class C family)
MMFFRPIIRYFLNSFFLVALLISLLFQCKEEDSVGYSPEFQKLLNQKLKKENFRGSYVLIKNGKTILRNKKKNSKSIKIPGLEQFFLTVGILKLEEKGKLNINSPVHEYLSNEETKEILEYSELPISSFLNHTSGLGSELEPGGYWYRSTQNTKVLKLILNNYQKKINPSHSLKEFYQDNFFTHLGMKNSKFDLKFGLEISFEDFILWEESWAKGNILKESSIGSMIAPTVLKDSYATNSFQYGFGVYSNGEYYWNYSSNTQSGLLYYRIKAENIGIIIFSNKYTTKADLISWKSIITESIYGHQNIDIFKTKEVESILLERNVPALGIAIVENFKITYAKNFGVLDQDTKNPVTRKTLFRAGSLSKPITALSYLKYAESENISLNTDLNNFAKELGVDLSSWKNKESLTANNLLSHSSGITERHNWSIPENQNISSMKLLNQGKGPNLYSYYSPGKKSRYSGGGYAILQEHLTKNRKTNFSKFTEINIFQPLKMNSSTWTQNPKKLPEDRVSGHDTDGNVLPITQYATPELGAGGLWTTPIDIARFFIMIQNCENQNCQFSPTIIKHMLHPVIPAANLSVHSWIGRGLFLNRSGKNWFFYHGGHSNGHKSLAVFHRNKGYGIVIMTNSESGSTLIWQVIRSIFLHKNWDKFVN